MGGADRPDARIENRAVTVLMRAHVWSVLMSAACRVSTIVVKTLVPGCPRHPLDAAGIHCPLQSRPPPPHIATLSGSPMRTRLRANTSSLHLSLMLALTFSTGIIDAVGYLGLDRVFTGNMTGNVVILGMALVGADGLPIIGPIVAIVGFMLGALVAGRVLRSLDAGWTARSTVMLVVVGAVISACAIAMLVTDDARPEWLSLGVTGLLGFAMGMQAGVARHIAVKDVTTVVVTSTMVGLAYDSWLGGRSDQPWKRRLLALVLIGAGAALGAALLLIHIGVGMAASAVITFVVAFIGHLGRLHDAAT